MGTGEIAQESGVTSALQKIGGEFPAPISDGSQLPGTPALGI